jgi:hypothetical protein
MLEAGLNSRYYVNNSSNIIIKRSSCKLPVDIATKAA